MAMSISMTLNIYIYFVTYLAMMAYDTCGIQSVMFRGGGMVHPCTQNV